MPWRGASASAAQESATPAQVARKRARGRASRQLFGRRKVIKAVRFGNMATLARGNLLTTTGNLTRKGLKERRTSSPRLNRQGCTLPPKVTESAEWALSPT